MNHLAFEFQDTLGPYKVINVHVDALGLSGVLVVDNVAVGPSIGGLRLAQNVSANECFRLARAMTLKNAAAGLPHGGGKSVLVGDPHMPRHEKEQLIRAFACALKDEKSYIFGPDMGTDEGCMGWIHDEIGRAVGLPHEIGGIPLDELGATGFGLLHSIEAALPGLGMTLDGARVVVQGFGSVGSHAARFLTAKGAILVAASDSKSAVSNDRGLDVDALIEHKQQGHTVGSFAGGVALEPADLIAVPSEIWIPAARPDVIDLENVDRLQTKVVAEGANIPLTEAAEDKLHSQGVLVLPDFIANAGGVICAAMEYQGDGENAAFDAIAERISHNTAEMLARANLNGVSPRRAALDMATDRVQKAMQTRRWSVF
jgi:glutamate dehydrogenase (NAD(P)+)